MLRRISGAFNAWLMPSTEEYFEKRMELLRDRPALNRDVRTRERAILAVARLSTWQSDPAATTVEAGDLERAQRMFADSSLGDVLDEIQAQVRSAQATQWQRDKDGLLPPGAPLKARDVLREVVMDDMPDAVNPLIREGILPCSASPSGLSRLVANAGSKR